MIYFSSFIELWEDVVEILGWDRTLSENGIDRQMSSERLIETKTDKYDSLPC
jgi:hypothetical protein